jgi:hypothetical protein
LEKIEEIFSKPWLERANVFYYLRCACFLEFLQNRKKKEGKSYQVLNNEDGVEVEQAELLSYSSGGKPEEDFSANELESAKQKGSINSELLLTELC